jgi:hypothetical protein
MWNNEWKKGEDYPAWGDTDVYKKTIGGGYLLKGETPKDAYTRVCNAVARRLERPEMAKSFLNTYGRLVVFSLSCVYLIQVQTEVYQSVVSV